MYATLPRKIIRNYSGVKIRLNKLKLIQYTAKKNRRNYLENSILSHIDSEDTIAIYRQKTIRYFSKTYKYLLRKVFWSKSSTNLWYFKEWYSQIDFEIKFRFFKLKLVQRHSKDIRNYSEKSILKESRFLWHSDKRDL